MWFKNDVDSFFILSFFLYLFIAVPFDVYYSTVLEDLLKRVFSKRKEYADTWLAMQEKLLLIYTEALSSNCIILVKMIQVIHYYFSIFF